jgi:hypothetical protein
MRSRRRKGKPDGEAQVDWMAGHCPSGTNLDLPGSGWIRGDLLELPARGQWSVVPENWGTATMPCSKTIKNTRYPVDDQRFKMRYAS